MYIYLYTYELKRKEAGEGLCHAVQTYTQQDGEKSPKHSHLSPVPALYLHPYTQNTAQISWFHQQGKCRGSTPGKPGGGMKDNPSQGSQEWGMYNRHCIISSKLCSLTQSQDLWLPTVVPMATAATAALGPTATSEWCLTKGTVETLCCIPPQLLASSGKPYWNWNKVGKSLISQQLQLEKISSLCPWMVRPTNAVQWHLFSPDS